jgi:cytochrome P450
VGTPRIDLLDPASFAHGQPHEMFRWLRANAPVYRHAEPNGPGFYAVTRYDDVKAVGRDAATYSSVPTIMIADPEQGGLDLPDRQMMLMMDPPMHGKYRRLLSPRFTPRAVERLRARIGELSRQIIDAVVERGECDLVEDIAGELPSFVTAELLGLPLEDGRRLYQLTETIHSAPEAVPPGAQAAAVMEMFQYGAGVMEAKRKNPGDDLSSLLIGSEVAGRPFDAIDFNLMFMLIVDAGGDTTRNLVAGGMQALFDHPDQRRRLQADLDGLLESAGEEMLRFVSPVIYMRRTVQKPATLGAAKLEPGDKVVMYYGSANRDEKVFAEPDRFDVAREPNEHVAFGGGGPHFCLGAHVARIEIQAMLREILTRLPDIEPTGPTEWLPSVFISGPKHMPVRFKPGRRLGANA